MNKFWMNMSTPTSQIWIHRVKRIKQIIIELFKVEDRIISKKLAPWGRQDGGVEDFSVNEESQGSKGETIFKERKTEEEQEP
jgi:hypothetical protein